MTPRVAVVIPCHDDGETVGDALASLEAQEPHELVVVDDGSQDPATVALLAELEAGGTHVVHQQNSGLSGARMAGVAATTAPYVLPLDADDEAASGALAALADALDDDPHAAVAYGDVEIFGELTMTLRPAPELDPWRITYVNGIPGTSMVRRTALLEAGGWSMGSGYEDWDLWLSFAERGHRGVYVDRVVLRYRRRTGRMLADTIPKHEALYGRLRERHPGLFADRRRTRRASRAPLRAKTLLPVVHALPVSAFTRHRLTLLVDAPRQVLELRRRRNV
jgi:glycosyltransferase involved in cell wall biosynthesis